MKRALLIALLLSSPTQAETYLGLTVEPESAEPYSRKDYLKRWLDVDGDGEDTRKEVLAREKIGEYWHSPYTGTLHTIAKDLDIDHMIPLKEAHESGGYLWGKNRKREYANDMDGLIAVSKGSNRSKGARDPAEWLPPNRAYWCDYLWRWVSVKKKWKLSADKAEVNALKIGFSVCKKYKNGDRLGGRH